MCGLGHLFERQGIATTAISLIRLHAEKIAPPRALWVPFDLGRPFGAPNNAEFQGRVVRQALSLLEHSNGPVLQDFPEDEPERASESSDNVEPWSCPISFARNAEPLSGPAAIKQTLVDEISTMQPWFGRALQTSGRTTVTRDAESMEEIATLIASMFEAELPSSPDPELSLVDAVRLAAEDLKAFMLEGAAAQPGNPTPVELNNWFWHETKTAEIFHQLRAICKAQESSAMQTLGFLLVPLPHQRAIEG